MSEEMLFQYLNIHEKDMLQYCLSFVFNSESREIVAYVIYTLIHIFLFFCSMSLSISNWPTDRVTWGLCLLM